MQVPIDRIKLERAAASGRHHSTMDRAGIAPAIVKQFICHSLHVETWFATLLADDVSIAFFNIEAKVMRKEACDTTVHDTRIVLPQGALHNIVDAYIAMLVHESVNEQLRPPPGVTVAGLPGTQVADIAAPIQIALQLASDR